MPTCNCNSLSKPLRNMEQIHERCKAVTLEVYRTLEEVRNIPEQWLKVFRCRICGTLFAEEYPFSEMHGGGPTCLYRIEASDLDGWLSLYKPLTPALRQATEDDVFLKALGEDVGPEACHHNGCKRLRIRNSVMCKQHHFEMVKGRLNLSAVEN